MFTGIIEQTGKISAVKPLKDGKRIRIETSPFWKEIKRELSVSDSISVNGVCLTVVELGKNSFWVEAVGETMNKTTFSKIKQNEIVNLERALRLSDRLGGHIVLGHVNGIGKITALTKAGENYYLDIQLPANLLKYVIAEGSIAVDGISLTTASVNGNRIRISIIPYTYDHTNLKSKRAGDDVNIEVDILAKYLEKLLLNKNSSKKEISELIPPVKKAISWEDRLTELGF